jgi:glycosyltransferase involved in cell wall biosynthesis
MLKSIPFNDRMVEVSDNVVVTVACITYNHVNFIKDALEGFLMQRTNFRVQVLVHDDASTDGTTEILKEYEAKFPSLFKMFYQPVNTYNFSNRYELMKPYYDSMIGKYIAWCEGDDYWIDPLKLQRQVDFLEENSLYSMCFHNAIIYEKYIGDRNLFLFNNLTLNSDLLINDIIWKWVVPTASMLFRKENLVYPNWMAPIYSEDYSMLLNLFINGKIKYIDTISSVYRKDFTASSVSTTVKSNFVREQHILLLDSFNKGTNKKYDKIIMSRIKYLTEEIALREAISHRKFFKLIFMMPQIWRNRKKFSKVLKM